MKLAYVIHWNEGPESGVFKKVYSQILEWERLGHEVILFVLTNNESDAWELHAEQVVTKVEQYEGWRGRYSAIGRLCELVRLWGPNMIYHRFDLYYPSLHRLLRQFPSVLEINTNDLTEMSMEGGPRYVYHLLTRRWILRAANGYVFVSKELSMISHYRKFVNDHIVIGNGIELALIPDSAAPAPIPIPIPTAIPSSTATSSPTPTSPVRLVFIGSSGQSWHGIDKIAQLATHQTDWSFDIIGMDKSELTVGDVPANMTFHGKLTNSQYEPIMLQADVAIGTLALHRKQMIEASPLKVREYLAYGIPVIMGYTETDFPLGIPFILELPNELNNIEPHLPRIRNFIEEWKGRRIPRELVSHLDTKVKEAIRVAYMMRIIGQGGAYEH